MIRTKKITQAAARWSILATVAFLVGCSSTYNEYFEDEHLPNQNVTNGEDGTTFTDEIIPTLCDPQYEIIKTRGAGPFEPYSQDEKHWLEAPFHAFALLTSNSRSGAYSVDYSINDDVHRLLWNQTYFMDDAQGNGHFYKNDKKIADDQEHKYYNEHKDFRYKFFLFHSDDAVLSEPKPKPGEKKVTCDVTLDGTQDLMHSFAYHTREEYNSAIAQLPNDATTALFLQGNQPEGSAVPNEYIYSGMSGNRGIHPIFNMNHLLTRFKIRVQGAKPSKDSPDNYLYVLIDSVKMYAPKKGTLTVADDSWEEASYKAEVSAGTIFRPDASSATFMSSEVEHHPMSKSEVINEVNFKLLDDEYKSTVDDQGRPLYDKERDGAYHHVKSMESDTLAKDFLLPPQQTYEIRWHSRIIRVHKDKDGVTHLGTKPKSESNKRENFYRDVSSLPTIVKLGLDENGNPLSFQPGTSYTINLFVYGESEVKLTVKPTAEWDEGGEVDINKDDEEYLGE